MPVKPTSLPPPWGGAGNYSVGVYPAQLPWGAANPVAGDPLPWGGQPRLNAAGIIAFANSGLTPQVPTDASVFNEWLRRVQIYAEWVDVGTNAPDADAHIVETDAFGQVQAQAFTASAGFQNAGSTPAVMLMGVSVPAGETVTFDDASTIVLVGASEIDGDAAAVIKTGIFEFATGAAAPGARQMSAATNDRPIYNRAGTLEFVNTSPNGYVYATGDQEASTGLAATHNVAMTTVAVTAIGLGSVRVIVEGQVQVNSLGSTFTLSVQEDQTASPAFTAIGASQVALAAKDNSVATDWQPFRHERVFNAGILTATLYRLTSTAQGGNTHQLKEVRLRVVGERG